MIKDQTVGGFLEDLASAKPTPGGGAVAAVAGALSAALVEMVINLTKNEELRIKNLAELKELKQKLLALADEDVTAFNKVMEAYRSKDKGRIKAALDGAIAVPEETKKLAEEIEELAKLVEKQGNKNAVSDARTAIYLAQAAQKSAQENIEINEKAIDKL